MMERSADFSGILGETFKLVGDGARGLLLFALLTGGVGAAGVVLGLIEIPANFVGASVGGGYTYQQGDGLGEAGFGLFSSVVTVVAAYFLISYLLNQRGRLPNRETQIWAYFGMTLLSLLGLMVGFMLLIIPGIILLCRWSAASGFLIGSRTGIVDALGNSWDATRGSGWSIFGAGLVLLLGLGVVGAAIGGAVGATGSMIAVGVLSQFANAVSNAVFIAFGIAVYLLVNNSPAAVREVFE